MTDPTLRAISGGCLRGFLIYLGSAAVLTVVVSLALLLGWLCPLPAGVDRGLFTLLIFCLAVVATMLATLALAFYLRYRRGAWLDGAFAGLGLQGSPYQTSGRQLQGELQGRRVEVYYYRGPNLEIKVAARLQTRFAIGTATGLGTALAGAVGARPIPLDDPAYQALAASAHDPAWFAWVLRQIPVRDCLQRLTAAGQSGQIRVVSASPGLLTVRLTYLGRAAIHPAAMRALVQDVLGLVQLLEALPHPAEHLAPSSLESSVRPLREFSNQFAKGALLFSGGLLGLMALGLLAGIVVLFFSGS